MDDTREAIERHRLHRTRRAITPDDLRRGATTRAVHHDPFLTLGGARRFEPRGNRSRVGDVDPRKASPEFVRDRCAAIGVEIENRHADACGSKRARRRLTEPGCAASHDRRNSVAEQQMPLLR